MVEISVPEEPVPVHIHSENGSKTVVGKAKLKSTERGIEATISLDDEYLNLITPPGAITGFSVDLFDVYSKITEHNKENN